MQQTTPARRHHTPAQRDKILVAYQQSQLTQRKFAAQVGIGYSTLTLWLHKAATNKAAGQPAFVPVPNMFSSTAAMPAYRVQLPQGVAVEVATGFQPTELTELLQVVQTL